MRTSRKHMLLGGLVLTTGLLAMPAQALTTPPPDHHPIVAPGYTGSANAAEHRLIQLGFSGCSWLGSTVTALEHCLFP